jgi:hypothetical protein
MPELIFDWKITWKNRLQFMDLHTHYIISDMYIFAFNNKLLKNEYKMNCFRIEKILLMNMNGVFQFAIHKNSIRELKQLKIFLCSIRHFSPITIDFFETKLIKLWFACLPKSMEF